ncbi:MAG: His-Xaa-Ser repeat protein HxsA [Gammaproteobacteria bacterium]|nr:His-Xaa-Ser repeat protein HxsA [Gammaproteobacteria bacterium]
MKKHTLFLINSLAAAGLQANDSNVVTTDKENTTDQNQLWQNKKMLNFTLAAHRSHQSHGSHGSHRSSSGGGYVPKKTPSYSPPQPRKTEPQEKKQSSKSDSTPPISILPNSPATSPRVTKLHGKSRTFKVLVMRVQTALFALGYYNSTIDGLPGSDTAAAISLYEKRQGMKVTGRLSDKLLDNLSIDTNLIEKQTDR